MEICKLINDCIKIRILFDTDWVCDAQIAQAMINTCEICKEQVNKIKERK